MGRILLLLLLASSYTFGQDTIFAPTTRTPEKKEARIIIRCGSIQTGNPLLIIDGSPADYSSLRQLDTSQIERITILKASAASAIFGYRASNGVIVITTKKARRLKIRDADDSSVLAGATVRVLPHKKLKAGRMLTADRKGEIDLGSLEDDTGYELEVSCIGYKTKTLTVSRNEGGRTITLEKDFKKMEEVMVVCYPAIRCKRCGCICYTSRSTCYSASEPREKTTYFLIYPNPVSRSGTLRVKFQGTGKLEILNLAGQLIQTVGRPSDKNIETSISLKNLSAGTYFVRLTTVDQKACTQKLVVQ